MIPNDWWICVRSARTATLINVLYHKFVVDANRLAYWLGKLVVMAPRKLALCKYFPYSCFLYTSFCAVLSISEVNSRHSIHPLIESTKACSVCG